MLLSEDENEDADELDERQIDSMRRQQVMESIFLDVSKPYKS
jgi:hypothetical protein